ncbi:hypothetical protein BC834DRAFT_892113, partial [Gloeopeniophorella convolvens]
MELKNPVTCSERDCGTQPLLRRLQGRQVGDRGRRRWMRGTEKGGKKRDSEGSIGRDGTERALRKRRGDTRQRPAHSDRSLRRAEKRNRRRFLGGETGAERKRGESWDHLEFAANERLRLLIRPAVRCRVLCCPKSPSVSLPSRCHLSPLPSPTKVTCTNPSTPPLPAPNRNCTWGDGR